MRPVVALLTDFGLRDHYAGTMKGVVLRICPDANLVDIAHDIAPQDVLGGGLELAACYRYFPPGTVFLAVVDPGVGSRRRAIAVAAGDFRFVAPDNGLLSPALAELPPPRVVELTEPRYRLPAVGRTFEGRDVFAPAAAWLATGVELESLGPAVGDYQRLVLPAPALGTSGVDGEVVRVDRFGNLVSNIGRALLERAAAGGAGPIRVRVADVEVGGIVTTYAEVEPGAVCALVGSSDRLEIAVNGGSAADRLGARRGARIVVRV